MTQKQLEILKHIVRFHSKHGRYPSYRETAHALDLNHHGYVQRVVEMYTDSGVIEKDANGFIVKVNDFTSSNK